MSVHTKLSENEIQAFLHHYTLAPLVDFFGVEEGITNTIYKIKTETGVYLLTVFEHLTTAELPFFLDLMIDLQEQGLPVQKILNAKKGQKILTIANKPAVLATYLPGVTLQTASMRQLSAVGEALGKMHQITKASTLERQDPFTLKWHIDLAKRVMPFLNPDEQQILQEELAYQKLQDYSQLPMGICHMDLFMDNVLFEQDNLSGILDFYYACSNYYALDLAVTMCAWSLTPEGVMLTHGEQILKAYQAQRTLSKEEMCHLNDLQRFAALHYWLTRLRDKYLMAAVETVLIKDPGAMQLLLTKLINVSI